MSVSAHMPVCIVNDCRRNDLFLGEIVWRVPANPNLVLMREGFGKPPTVFLPDETECRECRQTVFDEKGIRQTSVSIFEQRMSANLFLVRKCRRICFL